MCRVLSIRFTSLTSDIINDRIWLLLSINYKNSVNVAVFWGYKYHIRNRILLIRWQINMFHLLMCCNDKMNPVWLKPICSVLSAHSWMCVTSCSVADKTQPTRANKRKNTSCKINHKLKQMSRIRAVCTSVFVQKSPLRRDDNKSLTGGVECGKYAGSSYCFNPPRPKIDWNSSPRRSLPAPSVSHYTTQALTVHYVATNM